MPQLYCCKNITCRLTAESGKPSLPLRCRATKMTAAAGLREWQFWYETRLVWPVGLQGCKNLSLNPWTMELCLDACSLALSRYWTVLQLR